jgi:hypothetical protein
MMLTFKYDLQKDIENYLVIANVKYKGGDSKVLNLFSNKFGNDLNEDNLRKFIDGLVDFNKIDIESAVAEINRKWRSLEETYAERADMIFGASCRPSDLLAYLTTNDRCSYNFEKEFFFVCVMAQKPLRIVMHELLHFYTIKHFSGKFKKMDSKLVYDIKESMTEMLNLEFADLLDSPDLGYPQHKAMRDVVCMVWEKTKNIDNVYDELIKA